mgnify:CR=1 FL=1
MDFLDIMDQISELKHTVYSLKAVAGAFSNRYTEGNTESNILAINTSPEDYTYLFYTLTGIISEAKDKICDLETAADKFQDEGSKTK